MEKLNSQPDNDNTMAIRKLTPKQIQAIKESKKQTKERRNAVKDIITNKGLWYLNTSELARTWNCSRETINRDTQAVLKTLPPEAVEATYQHISTALRNGLLAMQDIVHDPNTPEGARIKAYNAILLASTKIREAQEGYGYKAITPQNVQFAGVIDTKVFVINASNYLKPIYENGGKHD